MLSAVFWALVEYYRKSFLNIVAFTVKYSTFTYSHEPGHIAQSVTCLATDASLTADPGVASSIPVPYFRGDSGPFPAILGKGPWPKLGKKDRLNIKIGRN